MDNKKKNNVNKPAAGAQKNATEEKSSFGFAFGPMNYILMIVGIMLLGLGYILLSGGGSDDPNVFNAEMFNNRRMVVAPLMIVVGLVVEICAIMFRPKEK
ncbi:MAG: DUF3098 domain-containing protein [Bacteroidales bacterium]|nr:DUF3098 domain-containing protein [Bacteroidales bacterium]